MKYFLSKTVTTEFTTLSFVTPPASLNDESGIVHYCFDHGGEKELHGVDCTQEQVQDILDLQHAECDVEQVDFVQVEEVLRNCRFAREINDEVISAIRSQYSIDDELKVMKLAKTNAEYVAMMGWINSCRQGGDEKKIALGIKQ